jgi:hypothetical protein
VAYTWHGVAGTTVAGRVNFEIMSLVSAGGSATGNLFLAIPQNQVIQYPCSNQWNS